MIVDSENPVVLDLPNGLRLLYVGRMNDAVEFFGVAIDAGSRDDPADGYGLAHFVEHTIFKGTGRRKSWHIINRMESCGGELNAYTTKETTTVYSVFPSGNLSRAVDLIGDLVTNSQFPDRELDKERDVVADEISSYLDIPSEAVYDDFEDLLFAGSALGHNILGSESALAHFDSSECRRFVGRLYTLRNMVAFYSGPASVSKVVKLVERSFSGLAEGETCKWRAVPPVLPAFYETRQLSIHQSHTIVGSRVCDMFSDGRLPLALLVNLLGGPGMNSLLNVEMREKRGLVYSVDASATLMSDCGVFAIYYGCDAEDASRCRRIVDDVIGRLVETPLTDRRFSAIQRQYIGQMIVGAENRENTMLAMSRAVLYGRKVEPLDRIVARIEALSPEDLRQAAGMIAPDRLSTLTFC